MSSARVKGFPKPNLMVLVKMRLHSLSEGNVLDAHFMSYLIISSHSYARSADALKELTRLIPNFQKKIDEAEPDVLQEFYSTVSTLKTTIAMRRSFYIISSRMAQRMHVVTMFPSWWAALQSGWTSSIPMSLLCQPSNAMVVVSTIPLLVCSSAPLDMTGMMKSTNFLLSWIRTHVHELIGHAPSFVKLTPTMTILLTFAFAASITVLKDPAIILRKDFYRAHCLWRPLSIFLHHLPHRMISPFSTMMKTMRRTFPLLRKPAAPKLTRWRLIHERRLQLIYTWLVSLHGLLPTQRYRYEVPLIPYTFLTIP